MVFQEMCLGWFFVLLDYNLIGLGLYKCLEVGGFVIIYAGVCVYSVD
jgi:hypothetical protein